MLHLPFWPRDITIIKIEKQATNARLRNQLKMKWSRDIIKIGR